MKKTYFLSKITTWYKKILIENSHKINDLKSKCKSKGIIDVSASFQAGMKYKEDDKWLLALYWFLCSC